MEYTKVNHKNLNENNQDLTWEGWTGLAVYDKITDSLNDLSEAIENLSLESGNSIKSIEIRNKENDNNTIQYTYTNNNNETAEYKEISLTPVSTNTGTLIVNGVESLVVKYGLNIDLTYEWEVRNASNTKINYSRAIINATVNGTTHRVGESVAAVRTNTNLSGIITLDSDWFVEGSNTVTISFDTSNSGAVIGGLSTLFSVDVINPVLNIEWNSNEPYSKRFSDNDLLNLNLNVTNSSGGNLTIRGQLVVPSYLFYFGSNTTPYTLTEQNDISNLTLLQIYLAVNNSSALSIGSETAARIFIKAVISIGSGSSAVNIYSNVYMLQYFKQDYNGLLFATIQQVNDVGEVSPYITFNQYTNLKFNLYAYTPSESTVSININNGSYKDSKIIPANTITDISYQYLFKESGNYDIKFTPTTGIELIYKLIVKKIGDILEMDPDIELSLHTKGKSKSSQKEWAYGEYETEFVFFDWSGNGWDTDVLRINDGARATINFHPFATNGFTVSFRFLALYGNEDDLLISCGNNLTFFRIYPEKAQFSVNGAMIQTEFNSTEIHEVTFVRYSYSTQDPNTYIISIYVDGICQKSVSVQADSGSNFTTLNNNIVLTALNSLLNVYDIVGYNKALSFYKIQAIYNYNMTDATDALNYVVKQNILTSTKLGDNTNALTIDNLPVGAVYMVISAYKDGESADINEDNCLDPTPWFTINNYTGETGETSKKIRHAVGNIKLIQKTADGSPHPRNFCVDRATFSGQGTSSMYYPIKNFRFYFKKTITEGEPYYDGLSYHGDKVGDFCFSNVIYSNITKNFKVLNNGINSTPVENSNIGTGNNSTIYTPTASTKVKYSLFSKEYGDSYTSAPVNIFCLKADYAESSGSHNTGFARMAHDVLTNTATVADSGTECVALPQQAIIKAAGSNAKYKYDVRSTVDGLPVYLFFKSNNDASDSTAVYFGKFNLNNEKATAETFGFEGIHDYFANEIVRNEGALLKDANHFNDTIGYFDITHNKYSIDADGKYNDKGLSYINPTECWEFSNNTFQNINIKTAGLQGLNNIGAFQFPYNNLDNPFTVTDNSGALAWLSLAWEYRYPDIDGGSAADNLYVSGAYIPPLLNSLYKWLYNHSYPVWQDLSRLEDFANNLNKYFNINFLLKYFMLTKMFGNVDQRIKNCMLSFYCDPFVEDNNDSESPMGHMRAFYIFYDNDTILGVDNNGNLTQPWDVDEDVYPGAGIHAIWTNLEECHKLYLRNRSDLSAIYKLGKKIERTYQVLRSYLTDTNINNYLVKKQEGYFPDVIHNLDEEIKYIYNENLSSYGTNLQYISKYQGNRRYHRKRWLQKRLNWLDAKFQGGNYSLYKYGFKISTTNATNCGGVIKISPAINNWRFYISKSNNEIAKSNLLLIGETASLNIAGNNFSISDFVDITALYGAKSIDFTEFRIGDPLEELLTNGVFPYLEDLIINKIDNESKIFGNTAIDKLIQSSSFPALKNLYFCNVVSPDENIRLLALNLQNLSNLEIVDCRGTIIDVNLPSSSHLTTLYLLKPTYLEIENKPYLNLSLSSIADTSDISRVKALKGNNSSVYMTLMNIAKLLDLSGENAEFVFKSSDDSKYNISEEEALLLLELENPTVSGKISTQLLTQTTAGNLTTAFPLFVIDNSTTGEFEITIDGEIESIKEGQTVKFLSNEILFKQNSDDSLWTYKVYDYNNNNQEVSTEIFEYVNLTSTYAELKLKDPTDNKTSYHYKLEVYANLYEDVKSSVDLYAIPLSSWTASASETIVNASEEVTITVNALPINQTKYDTTEGFKIVPSFPSGLTEVDVIPTITIGGSGGAVIQSSNSIHFIYNAPIDTDEYPWLTSILTNDRSLTENEKKNPTIKILNKIVFLNYVSLLLEEIVEVANMDIVKYFGTSGNSFEIPNLNFSNFSVPTKNVTNVTWNIQNTYSGYNNIEFGSNITQLIISGTQLQCYDLCLDLTKCTGINKISSTETGSNIARINLSILNTTDNRHTNKTWIKCPSTIKEIGVTSGLTGTTPPGSSFFIFNIVNNEGALLTNSGFTPCILINSTLNKIGWICSSSVSSPVVVPLGLSVSSIPSELSYYAYVNNTNKITSNTQTIRTKEIGNFSFYNYSETLLLELTNNVLVIGDSAFASSEVGHILTINTDNLTKIGVLAFSCTSTNKSQITLNDSSDTEHPIQIGANAFDLCVVICNKEWLFDKLLALGSSIGEIDLREGY